MVKSPQPEFFITYAKLYSSLNHICTSIMRMILTICQKLINNANLILSKFEELIINDMMSCDYIDLCNVLLK